MRQITTDLFLYSDCNPLSLGVARALQGLFCASPTQWPRISAAFTPLTLPPFIDHQRLLRLMTGRHRVPARFNLIGHSVGCRVLCSALQALAQDASLLDHLAGSEFNVALLQPATEADSLAPGKLYGRVQSVPKLRMLVTTSERDTAMGAQGPTGALAIPVDQRFDVTNAIIPTFTQRLGVANVTSLHDSDIDCSQVHDLLARFFGQ
jgi:hypothetical protein